MSKLTPEREQEIRDSAEDWDMDANTGGAITQLLIALEATRAKKKKYHDVLGEIANVGQNSPVNDAKQLAYVTKLAGDVFEGRA